MAAKIDLRSLWGVILAGSITFLLALTLVWLNVQKVSLSYEVKELQRNLQTQQALNAKLEVERMRLFSDNRLEELAERFGLGPPEKERIRMLPQFGAGEK